MRALVVYESMYGNTRQIAEAVGEGLAAEPRSFLVTKHNELEPHEREHAVEWGGRLAPATSRT